LKVLIDTNIILDILLKREEFVELSATVVSLVENKDIEGYLCATTITTLDYLITKSLNRKKAKHEIQKILNLFQIASVNSMVLNLAINSEFKDFEDAVQYYSGKCSKVDTLVTRNTKDYNSSELPVYSPDEFLKMVSIH
jgi:predicted nucleic acid-binding protein